MVHLLLLLLCLVAACSTPTTPAVCANQRAAADTAGAPMAILQARVGVEYLPPATKRSPLRFVAGRVHTTQDPVQVEPRDSRVAQRHEDVAGQSAGKDTPPAPRFEFSRERVRSIDNPLERMALRFVGDLVDSERQRLRRDTSTPRLTSTLRRIESGAMRSPIDEQIAEDEAARIQEMRGSLLNRPMRHALKEAFLIHEFELALDSVKAEHMPMSGAWQEAHPGNPSLGRVSLRLRPTSTDPLEIAYIRRQWRIATSSESLKVSFKTRLLPDVHLHLRANYNYENRTFNLFGDMVMDLDDRSRLHILAGNSMDLLTSNNLFPVLESPMQLKSEERSAAVLFFVEHPF